MSAPTSTAPDPGAGGQPKHRACDECRTRKLACTKEPDGCARCKREGIACHYSPQKPMGRPRKRPRDDVNESETNNDPSNKNAMLTLPPDTEDPGLAFLNFLTGGETNFDTAFDPAFDPTAFPPPEVDTQGEKRDWRLFGYPGNDFGQLNFDATVDQNQSLSMPNLDPSLFDATSTPSDALPNLSTGSSSSPDDSGSPNTQPVACSCTASLYLAIDSMQKLPNDVTAAVRQARLAAKTAYQVVNCPTCSIPAQHPTEPPRISPAVIQNFQNLMLLATLIPSIVHAYERILSIVDQETCKAQTDHRQIPFTLSGYGGVWGELAEDDACGASKLLEYRMMEPTLWRLTVRALLRVDVYGLSACSTADMSCSNGTIKGDPFHLGLKDIVTQMETRSKARHAFMDPLILSGQWEDPSCALKMHKTGETPTCLKIIAIARQSIDNLVIP